MNKKILVIAAHPDDEIIGCGGTLARHVSDGDEVHVIHLADGVTSRGIDDNVVKQRKECATNVSNLMGFAKTYFLDLKDNQLDSYPLLEIVQKVENICFKINPDILYTHHENDLNIDHRIAFQVALTCARPKYKSSIKEFYSFEIQSSTDWQSPYTKTFTPNYFVEITDFWEEKCEALNVYNNELMEFPNSRSLIGIESLARLRGVTVGYKMAEAFSIIRKIR